MSGLSSVDTAFLVIFAISILFGLMRGFIREVISLFTWLLAFIIPFFVSGSVAGKLTGATASTNSPATTHTLSMAATGVTYALLFLVIIMLGSFIGRSATRMAEGQGISLANRFLGALFGFARGFLITFFSIFLAQITPAAANPTWAQSQFVKAYDPAIKWADQLVQPELASLKTQMGSTFKNVSPTQYYEQLKSNFNQSGASDMFQQK